MLVNNVIPQEDVIFSVCMFGGRTSDYKFHDKGLRFFTSDIYTMQCQFNAA